jgi:hypothetical protein
LHTTFGGGHLLPVDDDGIQYGAHIFQHRLGGVALLQDSPFAPQPFDLALVGGIAGFQAPHHVRVLEH